MRNAPGEAPGPRPVNPQLVAKSAEVLNECIEQLLAVLASSLYSFHCFVILG